jgi:catechol 2,3-dioxygenase-like lactoylglutathione lyase family enzyme
MIDHVSLRVTDIEKSTAFYVAVLAPLGYAKLMEFPGAAGFGVDGKPDFWLGTSTDKIQPAHLAFRAPSREAVDQFHTAALAAGGKDNGAPGPRPIYHAAYYGAFVLDPDGHNMEAVIHNHKG